MADDDKKRKAPEAADSANKKTKVHKAWHNKSSRNEDRVIKPGDSGIWVTCHKGKERKCMGEMKDLFAEYIEGTVAEADAEVDVDDIEKNISSEIADLKKPTNQSGITAVWTDIQCLVFFRTTPPMDPMDLVQRITRDAAANPGRKRTRCTQRLTPSPLLGYASTEDLEKVARKVLGPYFHTDPIVPKKFAIRPTIRNHGTLKRDAVIKQVASIVGPDHPVDLKNFDLLILVDVNKNVCGVTVVDQEYERLKRYNLQEIFEPSSQGGA